MKSIVLPLSFFFICCSVVSQSPLKWGKISSTEAQLQLCPFDSSASAVVLADYGRITISNTITIDRHIRIKILDKKGLNLANVALAYYIKDRLEDINKVEAQTITIDKNGKTLVTEVPKSQFFTVDVSENWQEKRFSFPAVDVGSIIEYRFRKTSRYYFALDEWLFQRDIPTLTSNLKVEILSQGLDYRVLLQGERLLSKYKEIEKNPVSEWELQNLPALVEEPFVANYRDYAEKIHFQLSGYTGASSALAGGSEYKSVMTTWEKLGEELLNEERYMNYLGRRGIAKDALSQSILATDDEKTKIQKIYNFVRDHIQWNGAYQLFPIQNIGKLRETQQGGSAEINLFLTLLLQEAGLSANPMLVSTRKNGKIQKSYALLAQFNHVLAYVKTKDKVYLLDATDPLRPYDLLAVQDLNASGLMLDKNNSQWITIEPPQSAKEMVYGDIDLSNPSKPIYRLSIRYEGYEAVEARRTFHQLGEEKFLAKQKSIFTDYKLIKFEQENLDTPDIYLLQKYQLELEDASTASTLYFQPVIWHHYHENIFKGTKRNLPVELDYPKSFQLVLSVQIPEGYEVQEMPKPLLLALPDNMGQFRYQTTVTGTQLQLLTTVVVKSTFISSYYYSHLQQFYDHIIGKYQEKIVLRKK